VAAPVLEGFPIEAGPRKSLCWLFFKCSRGFRGSLGW